MWNKLQPTSQEKTLTTVNLSLVHSIYNLHINTDSVLCPALCFYLLSFYILFLSFGPRGVL